MMITSSANSAHSYYDANKLYKLIFSLGLCKHLLSLGYNMVDVTQHNSEKRLVFVFKNTELLHCAIDKYIAKEA